MIKGKGAFVIALSIGLAVAGVSPGGALSGQVREFLRQRIEAAGHPLRLSVGEELIYSSVALPKFYLERTFRPAWSDDRGPLPLVDSLLAAIGQADREGLFPADYHQVKIEEVLAHIRGKQQRGEALNPLRLVDLDLLSTDAFLVYASHLFGGKVDPETFDPEWHPSKRDADVALDGLRVRV